MKTGLLFKGLIITLLLSHFFYQSNAQQKTSQITFNRVKNGQTIKFQLANYTTQEVFTQKGKSYIVNAPGGSRILKKGFPDLVRFSRSIIVPEGYKVELKVIDKKFKEVRDIDIAPSKGNLKRNQDPNDVSYTYGNIYSKKEYFPKHICDTKEPYILRKYKGQVVSVNPFQYNAVTRVLKVYSSITVRLDFVQDKEKKNEIPEVVKSEYNSEYIEIYRNRFLNYKDDTKYTPSDEHGKMLIIAHPDFMGPMSDFIMWKKQAGIPVEIVDVTTIGDKEQIKTYVSDYYSNNGLTYLLLVGDAEQVPPYTKSGDSDPAYGHISGDDSYPEVIVGRFSGETTEHIETQVERVINYEKNPDPSKSFYHKAMGIASKEGGNGNGDDDEVDYQHSRNMLNDLDSYNYTLTAELFEGDQDGDDAAGNPEALDVTNELNDGRGLILYTGHGSNTAWGTSGFSVSDINALQNDNRLPFIFDVACVNGNFVGLTCFAESWMRATNNGNPTGAINIIASTINQAWNPPMAAQDEMVDILVESYGNNIKRTFGGITADGCMLMNDEYGSAGAEMTDTWTIFGDPSLMVRTDSPQSMNINHNSVIIEGSVNFKITGSGKGYATLMADDELLSKTTMVNGEALLSLPYVAAPDTLTLTVTSYNKIPYIVQLPVIAPNEPYIMLDSISNNELSGDNDRKVDYGEEISMDVRLANISESYEAFNVFDSLLTNDPYIELIDSLESFGNIDSSGKKLITSSFVYLVSDSVPDQYQAGFEMKLSGKDSLDNEYNWSNNFKIQINAPELEVGELMVADTGGNGDGILDAGENGLLKILVHNTGHDSVENVYGRVEITDGSGYLTFLADSSGLVSIKEGEKDTLLFPVSADVAAPIEDTNTIKVNLYGAERGQYQAESTKKFIIGEIPRYYINNGGTVNACYGYLYDSGGENGDYENNENSTMTIKPNTPGNFIEVNFTSFNVEENSSEGGCYDYLNIYDGNSVDSRLIGSYCNESPPSVIRASNTEGALTFEFKSDQGVVEGGWIAEFGCIPGDSLILTVTDGTDSLTGAKVKIGNTTITTNNNGQALFLKESGTYSYSVSKTGYDKVQGEITISGTTYHDVAIELSEYEITFNVLDEDNKESLEAEINFKDNLVQTSNGSYTFTGLHYEQDVPYTVSANEGEYTLYQGNLDVNSTKSIDVYLDAIEYGLNILVKEDNDVPLENATVYVDSLFQVTDSEGKTTFWLRNGVYECKVLKDGYTSDSNTITLDDTIAYNVKLLKLYEISLKVIDSLSSETIDAASVIIDTSEFTTDGDGYVNFELTEGTYNYSIKAEGYLDVNSSLFVNNEISETIRLIPASMGINSFTSAGVKIYPNPASGKLNIDIMNSYENRAVEIRDLSGRLLMEKKLNSNRNRIDVSDFSSGFYLIKVRARNKEYNKKILIQN